MSRLLRAVLVAAAALALVAASGCGGDTKSNNEYVDAINKVQTDFADSVGKTTSAPSGGDPQAAAKTTFANLKTAIDKVIADLKGVKPPDKVKTLHNELISEMQQFNTGIQKAGAALDSKDPQKILSAQTEFATGASTLGTKISQTIANINKKLQE
jgi:hypothetical protein